MSSVGKATADRNQRVLLDLINKPGNDACADCKAKGPRWASHNLGIFLCVHCASIHRKIGTHVTKVKSVTMDSWSREQVEVMKSMGNVASNAKYNPNELRHPPPVNREGSERDSEMEKYIRSKYEFKRFMAKLQDQSSVEKASFTARRSSPAPPTPPKEQSSQTQARSVFSSPSQSITPSTYSQTAPAPQPSVTSVPTNSVWNDLMSLSDKPISSSSPSPGNLYGSPQPSTIVSPPTGATPGVTSLQLSNASGNYVGSAFTGSYPGTSTNTPSSQPAQPVALPQGWSLPSIPGQTTPLVQQGAFLGPNPFIQATPTGLSGIRSSSPYPQQMLLQTQVHPNFIGTAQSPALGTHQSFVYQQGPVPNQSYAHVQQGFFTPSPGSQQPFQPIPGQVVNSTTYLQWQQTHPGSPSTPQYNQWTS